jgi:hypothetical protein
MISRFEDKLTLGLSRTLKDQENIIPKSHKDD